MSVLNNKDYRLDNTNAIHKLNSYHYSNIINLLRFLVIFISLSLGSLSCFLGYLLFKQNRSDLVYFATPGGSYSATKINHPNSIVREEFEIANFAIRFVQDGFAHSENNYRENIERALMVMTNEAGMTLKKLFSDDSLFKVYKEFNGVTTVNIGNIVTNIESYPYKVKLYFQTDLKFLSGQEKLKTHSYKQGVELVLQPIARCMKNPYGLIITELKFIKNEEN